MQQRRQSRPQPFGDKLEAEKARLREQLTNALQGSERDLLIKKIRQIETALHIGEWLSSPGLQPPRR